MDSILVLLHTGDDGALSPLCRETLNLALSLMPLQLSVGVIGTRAAAAVESIGACGAQKFLTAGSDALTSPRSGTDAAAAVAMIQAAGAAVVLAPCDSRFQRSLPFAAVRCQGKIDTHAVRVAVVDGKLQVTRWLYKQRIEATLTRAERPWIILVEPGCASPYEHDPQSVPAVTDVAAAAEAAVAVKTTPVGYEQFETGGQTIRPDASLLFVAGAGWAKKQTDGAVHPAEAQDLILHFIDSAHASLGSSKSLVDQTGDGAALPFLTHLHQVGQTGATPRHPKGLATCCHGEEPHVVGWRFINQRRAVNLDPNCGWARGKADVLYVADAFEVMKELNKLLS